MFTRIPQRSPSRGRPCCGAPPAAPPASADGRDRCLGPACVLPTHVRSTAASTVDADIMLSMTSAVARHCISPRCSWDRPAGLVHPDARRSHSVPAQRSQLHRSACSAHGTLTQAPRGVVPEPGTRATGRVLCSAGHGHRVLSIPVQDRPRGRSDRPYRGSGRPYSENERSRMIPTWN